MCIGIPMQVKELGFCSAICEGMGIKREIDTLLVGEQALGTWLLVFMNSAREVISEEDAQKISQAIEALGQVMEQQDNANASANTSLDVLFADLVDRVPPKPESLIALEKQALIEKQASLKDS